jgi:hypothetical protein
MTPFLRSLTKSSFSLMLLFTPSFAAAQGPGEPPPVPGPDEIAVQPRGPVHEAFASPPNMPPQPGPVVPKQPPEPIPEVPPDQRPEGDNAQWIPGYWVWDAQRGDFFWVSGVWRVPPPDCQWMPGAWHQVEGGYQWSPGFWAPAGAEEMPYLPEPPASLDNGPNGPPPNDDSFYVPGNWVYRSSRYLWQPGYWRAYRPNQIWMPPSYIWTPSGYLFVPGYWDWPLARRGLLFAPVGFNRPLWNRAGWFYQPSYSVPYNGLLSSLFLGPAGTGYYFGNYYGPRYRRLGFQPWFANSAVNPLFAWYRWRNANNAGWFNNLRAVYAGSPARPPLPMVQPLSQLNGVRLAQLSAARLAEQRSFARRFQELGVQRQKLGGGRRALPLAHTPALTSAFRSLSARPIAPASQHIPTGASTPHFPISPRTATPHLPVPSPPLQQFASVHRSAPMHPPAPVHHAPPAPAHHMAAAHRFAPAAHAPASSHHHSGGGHNGGHHR